MCMTLKYLLQKEIIYYSPLNNVSNNGNVCDAVGNESGG